MDVYVSIKHAVTTKIKSHNIQMSNESETHLHALQGVCIINSHLLYNSSKGSNSCCVNRNNDI